MKTKYRLKLKKKKKSEGVENWNQTTSRLKYKQKVNRNTKNVYPQSLFFIIDTDYR